MDYSSECAICASKSEWWWVVNPTILLRWDQVVNQVVWWIKWWMEDLCWNGHGCIQESRNPEKGLSGEETIPICGLFQQMLIVANFIHRLFQQMKGQRRKEERRTCSCPVGTATKGIACWYYYVWLLLSSSPLYVHWNHLCTVASSETLLGQSVISLDISWPPLPPSIISLVCWNHSWTSCYFRDYLLLLE